MTNFCAYKALSLDGMFVTVTQPDIPSRYTNSPARAESQCTALGPGSTAHSFHPPPHPPGSGSGSAPSLLTSMLLLSLLWLLRASPGEAAQLQSTPASPAGDSFSRQGPSWGIFMHPASPAAGMRGDIPAHRKGMPESLHRC